MYPSLFVYFHGALFYFRVRYNTLSMIPQSCACSAVKCLSLLIVFLTNSMSWLQFLATILLIFSRIDNNSLPSFWTSEAAPLATPDGWCNMTHVFGNAARIPFSPLVSNKPPIARALPNATVPTLLFA